MTDYKYVIYFAHDIREEMPNMKLKIQSKITYSPREFSVELELLYI